MQSAYSWMGTRIHLVLEDDFAADYNRAQDAFFEAQHNYNKTHTSEWTGREMIEIDWTPEEQFAWNKIAELINLLIEMAGGALDVPESEVTSDYLIKI